MLKKFQKPLGTLLSSPKKTKSFLQKKLDNYKNLCYNKYVRLRDNPNSTMEGCPSWTKERSAARLRKQLSVIFVGSNPTPSLLCGRGWNWYTRRIQNPLPQGVRVRISPPARGKVEPGASVAAQFPKISKEVNSKEISR